MNRPGQEEQPSKEQPMEEEKAEAKVLSILPIKEGVVFPRALLPLAVGQERSIKLIDDALIKDKIIGLVAVKDAEVEVPDPKDLYEIGSSGTILKMMKLPNGNLNILVQGLSRFRVKEFVQTEPFLRASIDVIEEGRQEGMEVDALMVSLKGLFQKAVELSPNIPSEVGTIVNNIDDPGSLSDLIAANFNVPVEEKQAILETANVKERLEAVSKLLNRELQILELGSKIQSDLRKEMDKTQREYYLREQLKAIQKELGEEDERTVEIEEIKTKIKEAKMPQEAEQVALKELDRLSRMSPAAAEYTVSRTYLDWLVELPWSVKTEDRLDIDESSKILDEDHYDLDKVKKRMLEYLAVRKLKQDMKGPILCFVGPPGTGKTSLGKSIARALGRKFLRMSLGGVRDEAEIRGHRRTYVGALPGRIIQGIKKTGSLNPVLMLDEIDKLGMDFRGDPSSALLEVLDPEQNFSFSDHYLEVAFDLSRVIFITTANVLETIPPALRDRMEVLDLLGYVEEEKLMIAQKYLVPRQIGEHGLKEENIRFEDEAIRTIARDYTREAGVRNLDREIAAICRGVAKDVASGKTKEVVITKDMVSTFLGPVKFFSEMAERTSVPGVVTGLAWTPAGGDIIFIEATKMRGKKTLSLTGSLGDVMKESAQAALSYVRSKAKSIDVDEGFFDRNDLHLHVPAGAIPKDGPSAGVAMYAALVSLLTDRPVHPDVAMTGEITLRGMVLPVGGIKEKVLAAKRAGIAKVILPKKNEKDLEEVPQNVKDGLTFYFVERMDEVIEKALTRKQRRITKRAS